MKKLLFVVMVGITVSSCAIRLGDLTMISNRNYDKTQNYVLLQKDIDVKVKTKKKDALSNAVDKATSKVKGGEFLQNASIWVSMSGKKMRIKGDVWGLPQNEMPQENTATKFIIGDRVQFKTISGTKTGTIVDVSSSEEATVKVDETGKSEKVKYKSLLKN